MKKAIIGAAVFILIFIFAMCSWNNPYRPEDILKLGDVSDDILQAVHAPVFSKTGGIYAGTFAVNISSGTPGAGFKYTVDGTDPKTSPTAITGSAVTVDQSMTLRSFAFKSGCKDSDVSEAAYIYYASIQTAIDDASDDDTVNISAGTFTAVDKALMIIDKPLTIIGSGEADDGTGTIIDGGTYGYDIDSTGLGINYPRAIVIQSDDVTLANMRIRGFEGNHTTSYGYGIVARALPAWGVTDPPLKNLVFENITMEDCFYGIRVQDVSGCVVQNTVYDASISDNAYYAVYINGINGRKAKGVVVRANTVNYGGIWITATDGGVIGGPDPADGNIVTDCVVNGIWYGMQFAVGTSSTNGLIQNNIVNGAYEGGIVLWNYSITEIGDNIRILNNTVNGCLGNVDAHGGLSVRVGRYDNLAIAYNTVYGNTIGGFTVKNGASCRLYSANINNNTFRDNSGDGIFIDNNTTIETVAFYNNNIYGNFDYGMQNNENTAVNAENNWWGHASGPDDDPGVINGSGSRISNFVDADPWANSQF